MASPHDGLEFEQALGAGDGRGSLVCVHGVAESDSTERLNSHNDTLFRGQKRKRRLKQAGLLKLGE